MVASTGLGVVNDNSVKDSTKSPSIIELYLVSLLLEKEGLLKVSVIDEENGRL